VEKLELVVPTKNVFVEVKNNQGRIIIFDLNFTPAQATAIACLCSGSVNIKVEMEEDTP
jgi:hypothetical protein